MLRVSAKRGTYFLLQYLGGSVDTSQYMLFIQFSNLNMKIGTGVRF